MFLHGSERGDLELSPNFFFSKKYLKTKKLQRFEKMSKKNSAKNFFRQFFFRQNKIDIF